MRTIDPGMLQARLQQVGAEIETARSPREINGIVERLIAGLVDAEFASLWIFDERRALLIRERADASLNEISIREQQGIIARSFLTMSGGIYNYLASEKEYVARYDNPDSIRIKSKIIVPLVDGERFLGLATAYSSVRRIRNFGEEDLRLMEALVPFLIGVVYRIRPDLETEEIERVYLDEALTKKARVVRENVETMIRQTPGVSGDRTPDETLTFLANTVHDIRTPANALYGFLELLEDRMTDPRVLQFVRNARESARFINELTTSILDKVARRHEADREPEVLNPIRYFSEIAAIFSANMYDKRIVYNVFLDPALPAKINLDAFRLKRVILNLIGNAWKFTPRGGHITVSVRYRAESRSIEVEVKDTGIGIAPEKQQKIFEAFAQAEEETAREYGGTGLGLSISARYVSDLGGTLRLQSALEKGSRFYFTIPVEVVDEISRYPLLAVVPSTVTILMEKRHTFGARNLLKYLLKLGVGKEKIRIAARPEEVGGDAGHLIAYGSLLDEAALDGLRKRCDAILIVEDELFSLADRAAFQKVPVVSAYTVPLQELYEFLTHTGGAGVRSRKALVVDDNRINIELLRAILEDELYQVEYAVDGEEGLRLLGDAHHRGEPFGLAFVDRHLPGMSGPEMMERFRRLEDQGAVRRLYAVSITGDPLESDEERRYFDAVMRKPFNRNEVKKLLDALEK